MIFLDAYRWNGCRGHQGTSGCRLIVKLKKIETLFKIIGMANPLINSGDAVLVVYNSNISAEYRKMEKVTVTGHADKIREICEIRVRFITFPEKSFAVSK